MSARDTSSRKRGFNLVEILLAVTLVGVLTAAAIMGLSGIADSANRATCQTTLDASRAAVFSYYSSRVPHAYPPSFDVMTTGAMPYLKLQGAIHHPTALTISSGGHHSPWTITLAPETGELTVSGTAAGPGVCA